MMVAAASSSDIAIIGMAATFAGAGDLVTYWQNIVDRVDAVSEASDSWAKPYFDPDVKRKDRIYTRKGGFLGDLAEFNPLEFGIMPNAVDGGEPDQYLALKLANAALKDAGYHERPFNRETTGVILGRGTYVNRGYTNLMQHGMMVDQTLALLHSLYPEFDNQIIEGLRTALEEQLPPFTAEMCSGLVPNVVSGRIANRLDLMGPNFIVDAACASSLIAAELAMKELLSGRCDMVLTGGVHASTPPQIYMIFCQLEALSHTRIRPFDNKADGVLLGEGIGILVLKRLADAKRDGDRIYAVFKGFGSSSDGKALGLLAPRLEGQILALQRAYQTTGIDPKTVDLVEAHGTGIALGDQTEIKALSTVFGPRAGGLPRCSLGSVKSMIGHCLPAAGAAGMIKTALALYHKVLPPTLWDEANPKLNLEETRLYVNNETRPWIHGDPMAPRRAGVSAFGFGGVNAHAVLEEYHDPEARSALLMHCRWPTELLVFTGDTTEELLESITRTLAYLKARKDVALANLAFSLDPRRGRRHRLAIIARDPDDLKVKLESVKARFEQDPPKRLQARNGIYYAQTLMPGKVAFLFPGEGSQYSGMLAELCLHFPPVRAWFDFLDETFHGEREILPSAFIFPPPTSLTKAEQTRLQAGLFEMDLGSEVIFTASMALYELLQEWGIKCEVMVGHSTGENTALVASGMLQVEDRAALAYKMRQYNRIYRKLLENRRIPRGAMLTVGALKRGEVEAAMTDFPGRVYLAMDNCPNQAVLFGDQADIAEIAGLLSAQGAICARLPFDRAYHTPLFAEVADKFLAFYQSLNLGAGHTPLFSCTAQRYFPEHPDEIPRVAAGQWAREVCFREAIEFLYTEGFRTFIEVGPSGNLTSFVKDILRTRDHLSLASNSRHQSALTQLQNLLGRLFVNGFDINVQVLYRWRKLDVLDLQNLQPSPASASAKNHRLELTLPTMHLSAERLTEWQVQHGGSRTACEAKQASLGPVTGAEGASASGPMMLEADISMVPGTTPTAMAEPRILALKGHFELMQRFLSNQAQVMARFGLMPDAVPVTTASLQSVGAFAVRTFDDANRWPLLGRMLKLTAHELLCERRFDLHRDLYLRHHTLGGAPSGRDPELSALAVIPFTFSMELIAESASCLVGPNRKVIRMRNLRGYRWLTLDGGFIDLRPHAQIVVNENLDGEQEVHVQVYQMNGSGKPDGILVFEGDVFTASNYRQAPNALQLNTSNVRPPSLNDTELYSTGMFHGPLLQGVKHLRQWSPEGIEAELEVLPVRNFFAFTRTPRFVIDAGLLDAAGQLVGYWLSEQFGSDFNCFPFRVATFEQFAPLATPTMRIICRGMIRFTSDKQLEAHFDLERADGMLIARLQGWEDRHFLTPRNFYECRLDPQRAYLSDSWDLGDIGLVCRRVEPFPEHFLYEASAIWKRGLAHLVLNRQERDLWYGFRQSEHYHTEWLLGRIAAKDAVRQWAKDGLGLQLAPADIEIRTTTEGKPYVACTALGGNIPTISITHSHGVAMAVAGVGVNGGIDLVRLDRLRAPDLLQGGLSPEEQSLVGRLSAAEQQEAVFALWCAKEAAAKALGTGLLGSPLQWRVAEYEPATGKAQVIHSGRTLAVRVIKRDEELIAVCADPIQTKVQVPS